MSDNLDRATGLLRRSREALPDEICRAWEVTQRRVIREGQSGNHVAMPSGWRGLQAEHRIAEHIALTASPDVVEAQERLLRLLANAIWHEETNHVPTLPAVIREAAEALAAAIVSKQGSTS